MIRIIAEKCTGCGLCVKACPVGALDLQDKVALFLEDKCIYCAVCIPSCPFGAIKMERKAITEDVAAFKGVWVFAEQHGGVLKNVALELLGKGRKLAEKVNEELCAVLLGGKGSGSLSAVLGEYGADKVYSVESEALETYSTDAYTDALSILIKKYKPSIMLYGASHVGRDLAPAVASNLGIGLTADCTSLSITEEDKLLLQTRPAFGGNVMADILCPNTRPQMATVRPRVMPMLEPQKGRSCEIVQEEIKLDPKKIRTKVLETIQDIPTGTKGVEEADVVVSGGRGVTKEDFEKLEELAILLSGTVGCSRPMVEKGYMPKASQVGQSGKTISPKLYLNVGISGQIQHEVGIRSSAYIVAINTDPNAPIFELADFGIVGDGQKIVPLLIEALKKRNQ